MAYTTQNSCRKLTKKPTDYEFLHKIIIKLQEIEQNFR